MTTNNNTSRYSYDDLDFPEAYEPDLEPQEPLISSSVSKSLSISAFIDDLDLSGVTPSKTIGFNDEEEVNDEENSEESRSNSSTVSYDNSNSPTPFINESLGVSVSPYNVLMKEPAKASTAKFGIYGPIIDSTESKRESTQTEYSNDNMDIESDNSDHSFITTLFGSKRKRFSIPCPPETDNSFKIASNVNFLSLGLTYRERIQKENFPVRLYRRRWVVIALFVLMEIGNMMIINLFMNLSDDVVIYYNWDQKWITMMGFVIFAEGIIASVLTLGYIKRFGLKTFLLTCAVLQIIGAWVCFLGTNSSRIWALITGTLICAFVQPCLETVQTLFVSQWFGIQERTRSVWFLYIIGWILPIAFVTILPLLIELPKESENVLFMYILIAAVYVTVVGILNLCLQQEGPPSPPNISSDTEKVPFLKSFPTIV